MPNPYSIASALLQRSTGFRGDYTQLIGPPIQVPVEGADAGSTIQRLFDATARVAREALGARANDREFAGNALFGDAPDHLGREYHRRLGDLLDQTPYFFRTDEAPAGRILEIQAPGSLWGDHCLLEMSGAAAAGELPSLVRDFVDAGLRLVDGPELRVDHLLDNASAPHTMRLFVSLLNSSDAVRVFGWDGSLNVGDCNLIRSHSVYGLAGHNHFLRRLERARVAALRIDPPPSLIFDQKVPLALPFEPSTRDFFDDDVRDLIQFSSLVLPSGVLLDGEDSRRSLEEFSSLPRRERRYFLKYAGSDVSLNWGSQAVFALHKEGAEACLERLLASAKDASRGRYWIIQRESEARANVDFFSEDGELRTASNLHAKFSRFFGGEATLGGLAQFRSFYKVHGQRDTVNSLAIHERVDEHAGCKN